MPTIDLAEFAALERALQRERKARREAEQQLEDFSRDLFESKQQVALNELVADEKQEQLSFLTSLLAGAWEEPGLTAMVNNYLGRVSAFVQQAACAFFQLDAGGELRDITYSSTDNQLVGVSEQRCKELIEQFFFNVRREVLYAEVIKSHESVLLPTNVITSEAYQGFAYVLLIPIYHLKRKEHVPIGIVSVLYINEDDIDITKVQSLESSRVILEIALQRMRFEESLKKRLGQLEETNKALEQMQQQLVEQEKLASLGMLAAGVAHEINNPIAFVTSNLAIMKDYIADIETVFEPMLTSDLQANEWPIKVKQNWEKEDVSFLIDDSKGILVSALDGLERVKTIVADLKTFSRMDNNELEPTDIVVAIKKALNMVANEFKYKHEIKLDVPEKALILGNEGQLQQVFINLFMNAKQAMESGGTLSVACIHEVNKFRVIVADEGCGIESDAIKDIFTPFYTTKAPGKGTGLGLAISYSILQQHSAKVAVESELGVGTRFVLTFFEYHA